MKKLIVIIPLLFIIQIMSQWVEVSNIGHGVTDISVVDANTVWLISGHNVYLSTNGGINFMSRQAPGGTLYAVAGISQSVCFIGDAAGNIMKSTNAGLNWVQVIGTGTFINDIVFSRSNPSIGIAFADPTAEGQPYIIAKTINSGNGWVIGNAPGTPNTIGTVNTGMCIDNSFYGFGLQFSASPAPTLINITTNGGINWLQQNLGLGNSNPATTLGFNDDKTNGIGSTVGGQNIARTTNAGINWMLTNVAMDGWACVRWIQGTNICYLSRYGSGIKKSADNGNVWTSMTNGGNNNFHSFDCARSGNDIFGYAVTVTGVVIKLTDNVIGLNKISTEVPVSFELLQNYPNPFNPRTVISFRLAVYSFAALTIFDLLGREAAALVNEQLSPGTYEVDWDASNYPSGVYYYQLTVNSEQLTFFTETKKMVLVK